MDSEILRMRNKLLVARPMRISHLVINNTEIGHTN